MTSTLREAIQRRADINFPERVNLRRLLKKAGLLHLQPSG